MKLQNVRVLALLAGLCLPQSVLAWNGSSHELVAGIAWDNMTPAARQQSIALLQKAPADACLLDMLPNDARPQEVREREFFMRAATWPDVIRKRDPNDTRPCTKLSQPSWHFKDRFWAGVSGAGAPKDRLDIPTPAVNAVERLAAFRHTVSCDNAPCGVNGDRAMQLAWMLHLAGDIHQPLHTASRVTTFPGEEQGDTGGNHFLLGTGQNPPKLHGFWDGIISNSVPRLASEASPTSIEYLDRVIGMIVHDHPRADMAAGLKSGQFDAWSIEGFETAKKSVYPATLQRGQTPGDAYRQMAFTAADEAIARAGYRLADVIEVMLAKPQGIIKTGLPVPSHIVIVIDENKSYTNIIGSSNAVYINQLASRGALLTKFYASHHPSQPNYIDFFAGGTLGVCDDTCPIGPFSDQNLGAALIAAGKSFAGYAENLPASGARTTCNDALFAPKHCPWVDFSNVPSSASIDFSQFPKDAAGFATLPDVTFVIPNLVNDMHNGSPIGAQVKAGNDWLKTNIKKYADWAETNNSLLIVTWDEDSSSYTTNCPAKVITTRPPKNHIATIVMGQPVIHGKKASTTYTHADLLRTILDIYGITPFGDAVTAKDITGIWK